MEFIAHLSDIETVVN